MKVLVFTSACSEQNTIMTVTPISLEAFLADQTGKYSVIARSAATKQSPAWQKEIASLRSQ